MRPFAAPHVHSGGLGMLIWPLVMIALGVLAAGVVLWTLRRHPQDTRSAAATTDPAGRSESTEANTGFRPLLLDPTFGGWPITGDFPLEAAGARRSGQ